VESDVIEVEIPRSEIVYYASRLLSLGTDIFVESPQELAEAIENKAREIVHLYRPQTS
jgi:predicted DNA-binding transcriptional regulator YafY